MMNNHEMLRPDRIATATNLLWGAVGIGIVILFREATFLKSQASIGGIALITAIVFVSMALLIYKISKGRNWARLTFLILFILGAFPYIPNLLDMFNRSLLTGSLSLVQLVMQLTALYFLFTKPGSTWFKKAT
jgi:hypothetical protein